MEVTDKEKEFSAKELEISSMILCQSFITDQEVIKANQRFQEFKLLIDGVSKLICKIGEHNNMKHTAILEKYQEVEDSMSLKSFKKTSNCLEMKEMMFILGTWLMDNDNEVYEKIQILSDYSARIRDSMLEDKDILAKFIFKL